jgi:hypothetical protein
VTAAHPILTVTTDSVFAGADVCREARLILPDGVPRPNFDDDAWDLTEVVGLPRQLALQHRRFRFAAIDDIRWRLVAGARPGSAIGTVTLSSSRQLGESVSEHCYAVLQGPPLPGRDH